MRNILALILLLLFIDSIAQEPFNKKISLGNAYTNITGIERNDTSLFCSGIYGDTLPPYRFGTFLYEFDKEGNFKRELIYQDSILDYITFLPNLVWKNDSILANFGYTDRWSRLGFIIEYDIKNWVINKLNTFYFPEEVAVGVFGYNQNGEAILIFDSAFDKITYYKLDGDYNVLINRNFFGDGNYYVFGLNREDLNGDIVLSGWNIKNKDHRTFEFSRTYVLKLDSNANKLNEYFTPINEWWYSADDILPTLDGGFLVASAKGYTERSNRIDNIYFNPAIFKLNANFEREWYLNLGNKFSSGDTDEYISKLLATKDSSGYIGIGQEIFKYDSLDIDSGVVKALIVKVTDAGDLLWSRDLQYLTEGRREHVVYDLEHADDGGFYITGIIYDNRDSTLREYPTRQGWLLKVDEYGCLIPGCQLSSTIPKDRKELPEIHLYPNPASESLNFFISGLYESSIYSGTIVNASGQIIQKDIRLQGNVNYILDVSGIKPGTYFMQLTNKGKLEASSRFQVVR